MQRFPCTRQFRPWPIGRTLLTFLMCVLWAPLLAHARECPLLPEADANPVAEATRLGQGLLWRIEATNSTLAPSYIYGTMHVDFPEVTRLAPPVALAFARARALVVEVVLDDEAQAVYRSRVNLADGAPGLTTLLGEPVATRYLQLAKRLGLERPVADRLNAWAAANLIARPAPRAGGVTLDEALQRRALASGRPVRALESMSSLLGILDSITMEDHLVLLVDAVCQSGRLAQELAVDVGHYLAGDLDSLMGRAREPLARDPAFGRHWSRLVDARNAAFMQALEPMLREGGHFIAVGALHLPGDSGLLARIGAAGYRLVREFGGRDGPAPGADPPERAEDPASSAR